MVSIFLSILVWENNNEIKRINLIGQIWTNQHGAKPSSLGSYTMVGWLGPTSITELTIKYSPRWSEYEMATKVTFGIHILVPKPGR